MLKYFFAINTLFTNEQLRATLSVNAHEMTKADYTWDSLAAQYQGFLELYNGAEQSRTAVQIGYLLGAHSQV
jgi:hypothetical protein